MELGLLIVHAFVGTVLAAHGSQKLFGWFGGYGIAGTAGYMESVGLRPGKAAAAAAGSAELAGGLLLALGLLTPLGALLVAATMLVAARTDHHGKGLWIYQGGSELVLTNAAIAVGLAFAGAGRWSLDAFIGWDVAGVWWGVGTVALAVAGAGVVLALARLGARALETARPSAA